MSIEMLCVGAARVELPKFLNVGIDTTFPPLSDRQPSLWQRRIEELGGTLIHLFDPQFCGKHARWAYDIIEERDWKEFRFRSDVWPQLREVMLALAAQSSSKTVVFFSDAQWSNEPSEAELSFAEFENLQDMGKIRMNTAYTLSGKQPR